MVGRLHEADIALADQVQQGQSQVHVVLGDFDDQPQVGFDHLLAGTRITLPNAMSQLDLFPRD